jgi:ribonuclease HI
MAEGNPGRGTYAYIIYQDEKKVAEEGGFAGESVTNNFAEYLALVKVLEKLKSLKIEDDIVIRSDSRLLIGQMAGGWKVRKGAYIEKHREAKELARQFGSITFEWIRREENTDADLLTRVAYQKSTEQHRTGA